MKKAPLEQVFRPIKFLILKGPGHTLVMIPRCSADACTLVVTHQFSNQAHCRLICLIGVALCSFTMNCHTFRAGELYMCTGVMVLFLSDNFRLDHSKFPQLWRVLLQPLLFFPLLRLSCVEKLYTEARVPVSSSKTFLCNQVYPPSASAIGTQNLFSCLYFLVKRAFGSYILQHFRRFVFEWQLLWVDLMMKCGAVCEIALHLRDLCNTSTHVIHWPSWACCTAF